MQMVEDHDRWRGHAISIARRHGRCSAAQHKQWIIDQMVRALWANEESYKRWAKKDEDMGYIWNTGVSPQDDQTFDIFLF